MRISSTGLLLAALALLLPTTLPNARAADLMIPTGRHRGVVVADYDGTPIYLYRSRQIIRGYDGMEQVIDTSDAYPVLNIDNPITAAVPTRYLNGQPVR